MTRYIPCPNCGHAVMVPGNEDDGRLVSFTVRLRAYDLQGPSGNIDPVYDSAPEREPDHPGVDVIAGVRNILTECAHELSLFHGQALLGLTPEYLDKKERGIRPTLSRTGGRGRMTLDYDTKESLSLSGGEPRYRARIDVNRLNQPRESDNDQQKL